MMKKIILMALLVMGTCGIANAQKEGSSAEERAKVENDIRKQLAKKASKEARKEAKRLIKEGWKPAFGELPIEKQVDRSWVMSAEVNEDGEPVYITADGSGVSFDMNTASDIAIHAAQAAIAQQIETDLGQRVERAVASEQISSEEGTELTRVITNSASAVKQQLKMQRPIMKVYRDVDGGKKEVMIRLAFPSIQLKKAAEKALRGKLMERVNGGAKIVDEMMGWGNK